MLYRSWDGMSSVRRSRYLMGAHTPGGELGTFLSVACGTM
jgi:hypothetical protein